MHMSTQYVNAQSREKSANNQLAKVMEEKNAVRNFLIYFFGGFASSFLFSSALMLFAAFPNFLMNFGS
jgi:hypothetical protein